MENTIPVALAAAAVSALVTWLIAQRRIAVENVTAERAKWRGEIRTLALQAHDAILHGKRAVVRRLKNEFRTLLNPFNAEDRKILKCMICGWAAQGPGAQGQNVCQTYQPAAQARLGASEAGSRDFPLSMDYRGGTTRVGLGRGRERQTSPRRGTAMARDVQGQMRADTGGGGSICGVGHHGMRIVEPIRGSDGRECNDSRIPGCGRECWRASRRKPWRRVRTGIRARVTMVIEMRSAGQPPLKAVASERCWWQTRRRRAKGLVGG